MFGFHFSEFLYPKSPQRNKSKIQIQFGFCFVFSFLLDWFWSTSTSDVLRLLLIYLVGKDNINIQVTHFWSVKLQFRILTLRENGQFQNKWSVTQQYQSVVASCVSATFRRLKISPSEEDEMVQKKLWVLCLQLCGSEILDGFCFAASFKFSFSLSQVLDLNLVRIQDVPGSRSCWKVQWSPRFHLLHSSK